MELSDNKPFRIQTILVMEDNSKALIENNRLLADLLVVKNLDRSLIIKF